MAFELTSQDASYKPQNLSCFIKNLRRFTQKSLVDSGTYLCWEAFRNQKFKSENEEKLYLTTAYSPRIVLLALAAANDFRNLSVDNNKFFDLCKSYLSIPSSISNKDFLEIEAREITTELENLSSKPGSITKEMIDPITIRETCSIFFISRGVGIQHRDSMTGLEEMYTDYKIIKLLDANSNNEASHILEAYFGMSVLHLFRSAFSLFSVGTGKNKNGALDFNTLTCDENLTKRLNIDLKTCLAVALGISYKESSLRNEWLEKSVLLEREFYQQYVPDPLFTHPIIHRDKSNSENTFLIPSPNLFIRGFRQAVFSILYKNAKNKGSMGDSIGKAIEGHIQEVLVNIFGKEKVKRLQDDGKHADFLVALKDIDLIVEVKTLIGGFTDCAVMGAVHTASMWNRLYKACVQCSNSQEKYKTLGRKTISTILVAQHHTAEHLPFQHYASKSGLFKELKIEAVEFLSWNALENRLSKTSIAQFEKALIEKWTKDDAMTVGDVMSLDMEIDSAAHSYEHLAAVGKEIFNKL